MLKKLIKRPFRWYFGLSAEEQANWAMASFFILAIWVLMPILTVLIGDTWWPTVGAYGFLGAFVLLVLFMVGLMEAFERFRKWVLKPDED